MNKKPILFSTPMVQAILEGRKTVTRRIIKARTPEDITRLMYMEEGIRPEEMKAEHLRCSCPYGKVGDILWVRESVWEHGEFVRRSIGETGDSESAFDSLHKYSYPATDAKPAKCRTRSSIHMPYDACRLFLKITDIRVERLQDIGEEQAAAEGAPNEIPVYGLHPLKPKSKPNWYAGQRSVTFRKGFEYLWESINGAGSWDENPYVWCVSFERTEKPQ